MINGIELRVHAGAPTSRADDDTYRAQAVSYLLSHHHVSLRWLLKSNADDGRATAYSSIPARQLMSTIKDDTNVPNNTAVFVEDTQLAYTALESQIVLCSQLPGASNSSPDRTAENQRAATPSKRLSTIEFDEASGSGPTESQSSYMRTPLLDRSNKRRRLEPVSGRPGTPKNTEAANLPLTNKSNTGLISVHGPVTSAEPDILPKETHEPSSQLPSSYSLSNTSLGSSSSRRHASLRSISDPGSRSPQASGSLRASRSNSCPSVTGDAKTTSARGPHTQTNENVHLRSPLCISRDNSPSGQDTADHEKGSLKTGTLRLNTHETRDEVVNTKKTKDLAINLEDLPLSIQPPEPTISDDEFTTHITPLLDRLAGLEVARAYRPVSVARKPRTWERGHWLINAASLEHGVQIEFWQKLQEYIGTGSCGWGVWCNREVSSLSRDTEATLGIVRVFCWGEIIQHIYLLLYSVSMSKVRSLGLQWIDAEELVVVQMRGP
nr:hypothetical protein CFP56_09926 [Quercus suber]